MNGEKTDFKVIQSSANIVEIIKSYINLESHGKNYFGVCPFHDDHSPSMSVSEDKQIYKCFVCGATGNVFTFVQNYLNISFLEAVKIVADKVGINFTVRENKEDLKNKKYYDIMELSTLFYQNNLHTPLGKEAREYLHKRGLSDEIIKEFSIGLALPESKTLYNLLKKKEYSDKEMNDLGLIGTGDNGSYDLFRNRIIFPLKSPTGKVNGFSGRIYNSTSNSKYINTKETVIFKKRENLYNYHLAAPMARQEKQIIICEGFMDAIRIYSEGVKNIVATMGTALAKEQVQLLKKLNVKVIIVMDNDNAGLMATASLGQSLMKENIDIGVVRLTGKKDPDEYILEYGIDAFKDNIKHAISFPEFMEIYLRKNKNLNNPTELSQYINDVIDMISLSSDELLIDITLNKLVDEFHLDKELLKSKLSNRELNLDIKVTECKEVKKEPIKVNGKLERATMLMLYYMMNDSECMKKYMRSHLILPKNKYGLVANNLLYYYELNKEIDFADYLTFSENYIDVAPTVKEIITKVNITEFKEEDMDVVISIIRDILDKAKINKLKKEMKESLDISHKKRLFEEIVEIKKGCVRNG